LGLEEGGEQDADDEGDDEQRAHQAAFAGVGLEEAHGSWGLAGLAWGCGCWLSAISWLSVIRYPLSAIRHPVSVSDESIRHDEDPPSPMEGETLSVDALAARSRGPRRRPRAPDGGCKRGAPGES